MLRRRSVQMFSRLDQSIVSEREEMNVTKITLLDFGVDELGKQFAKIGFEPLIGDSKDVTVVVLRKGDTLTTDIPVVDETAQARSVFASK
jgi:hypothetical protein